jgi:flagellum-specific peptidoglycan hydrolase FlgJ
LQAFEAHLGRANWRIADSRDGGVIHTQKLINSEEFERMSEDNDRQARLIQVAQIAVRLEKETGCPAQLLIAQWAIESQWGEKPVGHANYFGIKRAARHTKWCTIPTLEVFTAAQLEAWNHQHPANPSRVVATLPDSNLRVAIDDEFADYDSPEASCQDYAWLITHGEPYRQVWRQYQQDKNLGALIGGVARKYATAPEYMELVHEIATQLNVLKAVAEANTVLGTTVGSPG